jgi:hypothetical protein
VILGRLAEMPERQLVELLDREAFNLIGRVVQRDETPATGEVKDRINRTSASRYAAGRRWEAARIRLVTT